MKLRILDVASKDLIEGFHFYQRALSKKFPYAIYYSVEEDTVKIRSVIDYRRSSSWIEKHLKDV